MDELDATTWDLLDALELEPDLTALEEEGWDEVYTGGAAEELGRFGGERLLTALLSRRSYD